MTLWGVKHEGPVRGDIVGGDNVGGDSVGGDGVRGLPCTVA